LGVHTKVKATPQASASLLGGSQQVFFALLASLRLSLTSVASFSP